MIAFTSYPDDMAWELDVLRLDDRNTTRVAAGRATDYGFIETGYSWSPDSKTLAFYDVATDQLFTVNADGTGLEELTTPEMGTGNREPAWSPNADEIAYSAAGGLMLVSPRDHVERPLLADYTLYKPVWSPNGQFVASESSSEQGGIHFVEAATRKAWGWLDGQTVLDQAWAPDSVHIAYIGEEDNHGNFALFILDIFSGETRRLIELDPPMFSAIAWQP
jgi:Tol biopolymer transport system component